MPRNMDKEQALSGDEDEFDDVSNLLSMTKAPPEATEIPAKVGCIVFIS